MLKSKGAEYETDYVPRAVTIFNAALEKLHAPVAPAFSMDLFRQGLESRTLRDFVDGIVTREHATAAGVKRRELVQSVIASMDRYGLYV